MAGWQNGRFTKWQALTKWHVGKMACWQNGNVGKMACWQNGMLAKWHVGKMAC